MPSILGPVLNQPSDVNYLIPSHFRMVLKRLPEVVFTTSSFNIPGISAPEAVQPSPFKEIPLPGDKLEYEDLQVTFGVDEHYKNYRAIKSWMSGLYFPESFSQYKRLVTPNHNKFAEGTGTKSDIYFLLLDNQERAHSLAHFTDAFPVNLSGFTIDARNTTSTTQVATVTFKYTAFHLFNTTESLDTFPEL